MRKLLAATGVALGLSLFGGVAAFASNDNGYHAEGNSCDAGHGAFGAFSHHFAFEAVAGFNWIAADAKEDGGMGHETGPAESAASAACQGLNH
jgi:hypothetical protein